MRYNSDMDVAELKPPIWVDRGKTLHQMVSDLTQYPILSVDTESNSLHAYREQVCLIQFSTTEEDYLVDPLALDDLSELGPIFADPAIEKIFHAAEYDLICLKRDFSFEFANLFDTMMAARILGRTAVGLGALLEQEFGIQTDKRYQRANWGQRPLPPAQMAYARMDTHYLLPLRNRLRAELIESGRWELAQEDFRRGCAASTPVADPIENGHCWHISGSQDLTPQQLAVFQELCAYRDQQAEAANLPLFKVMSNQVLLEIARLCPTDLMGLESVNELSMRQIQRHGHQLLRAVRQGLNAPPLHRPVSRRPDEKFLIRLDALRNWRKETARQIGVESDVVLPRDLLYTLAERNPSQEGEIGELMQDTPWRLRHYGGDILRILKNGHSTAKTNGSVAGKA